MGNAALWAIRLRGICPGHSRLSHLSSLSGPSRYQTFIPLLKFPSSSSALHLILECLGLASAICRLLPRTPLCCSEAHVPPLLFMPRRKWDTGGSSENNLSVGTGRKRLALTLCDLVVLGSLSYRRCEHLIIRCRYKYFVKKLHGRFVTVHFRLDDTK